MTKKYVERKVFGVRISRTVIVFSLISFIFIGLLSYIIYRRDSIAAHAQRACDAAVSFAGTLDRQKFAISINAENEDEYWYIVKNQLDAVKAGINVEYMYIISPYNSTLFKYYAEGAKPGDDPTDIENFNNVEYDPAVYGEEPQSAIRNGKAVKTSVYDSGGFGYLVSGFAPIFDDNGKAIALVGVDLNVDAVMAGSNMFALYIICGGLILSIISGFMIKSRVNRLLSYSLRRILEGYSSFNNGDLSFKSRKNDSDDDIGMLYSYFADIVKAFNELITDINYVSKMHTEGEFDVKLDESKYKSAYLELVKGINAMTSMYIDNFSELLEVVKSYGNGDFNANVRVYPGKLSIGNVIINDLRSNFKNVVSEIDNLAKHAADGDLDLKVDANKYSGDWAMLLDDMNSLVRAVAERAFWYESILDAIPTPLSVTDTKMNWAFINKATEGVLGKARKDVVGLPCSNWGAKICKTENCGISCLKRGKTQTKFSQDGMDFQVDITTIKDTQGKDIGFVEIVQDVTKLESTIRKINEIMNDVKAVSEQVSLGAKLISESSQDLADGSSSQASAVEELNANIDIINKQTQTAAKSAANANDLTKNAIQNALSGNEEMQAMLVSMDEIKKSSDNISKIIKSIEDISFQTNLLSLNAAVEAARAGEHGKGFSVVADEVRTLAGRSQVSAKETNELITDTINKVNNGTEIAVKTARMLDAIVSNFENVSKIIDAIASASNDQAESIGQISASISQIATIAQSNSATSEEAAAASQELASQSDTLINLFNNM